MHDDDDNPYRRPLEDLDPARSHPTASTEHQEYVRPRPSSFTVEGYLAQYADLASAASSRTHHYRWRARLLAYMTLLAIFSPAFLLVLGIFR